MMTYTLNTPRLLLLSAIITTFAAPGFSNEATVDIEGEVTFGVNDSIEDKGYFLSELEFIAEQSFDNGFGWALSGETEIEDQGWGDDFDVEYEVLFEFITPVGTLGYGYMDSASESFFEDVGGMDLEVSEHDEEEANLRWIGEHGHFGYAISTQDLNDGDGDDISIGLGYDNDVIALGLAYDLASDTQDEALGLSAAYTRNISTTEAVFSLSYIEVDGETSTGLGLEAEFQNGLVIEAGFSNNSNASDGYEIEFEYENGPITVEFAYEGDVDDTEEEAELNFAYAIDALTMHAGYTYEQGSTDDTGYYAGVTYDIAENAKFGAAWSETEEGGDLNIAAKGLSAFVTISF